MNTVADGEARSAFGGTRPRGSGRIVLASLIVLLVVGSATAGAWWWEGRDTQRLANPATVQLPPPANNRGAVAAYFRGPGAQLLRFTRAVTTVPNAPPADECLSLAGRLDHIAHPRDVAAAALMVPDAGIRDAVENQLDAMLRYLSACHAARGYSSATKRYDFSATVLRRVLQQSGVR